MIAQLREMAGEFERRGVQILIVEPNDAYRVRYVVRRAQRKGKESSARPIDAFTAGMGAWLGSSGELGLTVVTDPASIAAASYGVAINGRFNSGGELFHRPATFLIDRDGVIRFLADYKDTEALTAEEVLAVLDDLEAKRALIGSLRDKSEALRGAADLVLALPRPAATESLPLLSRALEDEDTEVRAGAAAALGWLGFRAAPEVERLTRGLEDRDPRVRHQCGAALARIGPAAAKAVPALIAVLKATDALLRGALDAALRESPRQASIIFPSVNERLLLAGDYVRLRAVTISALERIGTAAATGLIEALDHKDSRVRLAFVEALGRFQPDAERVGPALGQIVRHDREARVREAAVVALQRLRQFDPSLVAALRDEDAVIRAAATSALERTGGAGHWEAVLALVAALSDADPRVREGAFYALDHRADGTVPTLIEALRNNDPQVRRRAAELMALLCGKAIELRGGRMAAGLRGEAAPALRAALTDHDPQVRQAAEAALAKIEAPAGCEIAGEPRASRLDADRTPRREWPPSMSAQVFALLALALAQSPVLERGSGFEFPLPQGWTRRSDEARKTTILRPPGAAEGPSSSSILKQVEAALECARKRPSREFSTQAIKGNQGRRPAMDASAQGPWRKSSRWRRGRLTPRPALGGTPCPCSAGRSRTRADPA